MYSLIIPIYRNAQFIPELLDSLEKLNVSLNHNLEIVFVIDGNPENEFEILKQQLNKHRFKSQLIQHSRNFGSFAAIKTGLENATGTYFSVMAADMQEPPSLVVKMFKKLSKHNSNIVIGKRIERRDSYLNNLYSNMFWKIYKKYIQNDVPPGGVDIFGCDKLVRDVLISLRESNSSLIGLLFWIGFKREYVDYSRVKRKYGKSAWSFNKKVKYMTDSIFSFSDLPIKILIKFGLIGILMSAALSLIVIISKLTGAITVPGYTATLLIVSFFSSINLFSFGIIGLYVWRMFENTKHRPNTIIMDKILYN
jgi:glycosyltransferase involved in cell wall biosynthesis